MWENRIDNLIRNWGNPNTPSHIEAPPLEINHRTNNTNNNKKPSSAERTSIDKRMHTMHYNTHTRSEKPHQ